MNLTLDAIRNCFEGAIPAVIATCAPDGTPNASYLSQVHYVDSAHVALSFQFFSKTRENVLANPRATVQVIDPANGEHYRLALLYLRTESEGPLFEYLKAKLAGVASHTGMSKVFVLRGADVYRVLEVRCATGGAPAASPLRPSRMPALRACARRLLAHSDLTALLDELLCGLREHFGIGHAMVLMYDPAIERLYTVASSGYAESGVGSEVALGAGVIGVAARERAPIRISYMSSDYVYSRAVRAGLTAGELETEIPFPGLEQPRTQLAVPILLGEHLLGVLYAESERDVSFNYEDEDALVTLADQLALQLQNIQQAVEVQEARAPARPAQAMVGGTPLTVRRFRANDSVFIGDDYLIKGVAGAIFWRLVSDYTAQQRIDFSNRELRLDPKLRLPDICDNLEARLTLLQRRLAERCPYIRIEKTGRGRFRLHVDRPLTLIEAAG
ncbi:MAG: GAF domain-containing protein [Gammaproteobacteria bacterium]|nr:GAF domain-containing protein [Gammaproteobacteria bacterium]